MMIKIVGFKDMGSQRKSVRFLVQSSNEKTTLEQTLVLTQSDSNKWIAEIEMEEFPPQATASEAAAKLGDWLVRLGNEMIDGELPELRFPKPNNQGLTNEH